MGVEIERKFLVSGDEWRAGVSRVRRLRQGYLSTGGLAAVRVRSVDDGFAALTIKGARKGMTRAEFEYEIPAADAQELLGICGAVVEKLRHDVPYAGLTWEIDEFLGANAGLVVAEVELTDAAQAIDIPPWIGAEVTEDRRYYNAELFLRPFSTW